MFRHYKEKTKAFFWGLLYEYRCAADWGADTSHVMTMRINKWTKGIKIIDQTVIGGTQGHYRTA